jgi:hypothetical protein
VLQLAPLRREPLLRQVGAEGDLLRGAVVAVVPPLDELGDELVSIRLAGPGGVPPPTSSPLSRNIKPPRKPSMGSVATGAFTRRRDRQRAEARLRRAEGLEAGAESVLSNLGNRRTYLEEQVAEWTVWTAQSILGITPTRTEVVPRPSPATG